MTKDEALKLALEALDEWGKGFPDLVGDLDKQAIAAIKEALAQPQQEPVLKQSWKMVPVEPTKEMLDAADDGDDSYTLRSFGPGVNRVMQGPEDHYAAMLAAAPQPPQRTWVGLTDEEITDIWAESSPYYHEDDFARAIEAKLKAKNDRP